MKIITCFIAFIITVSLFFACNTDDKFSTNNNLRLSFSNDTIRFDTVFTTLGTATKRLKIYNRNEDGLTINTVELMNSAKTGFRMNVDGESGSIVNNINILGKDSLYIFVEVTIDPLNQNNPLLITDSIRFHFNGVSQYVRLEAIGQDVIIWKGKSIDKDTTLRAEKPYLIYDSLYVKRGATLSVEKNVSFYFHNNAVLSVSGTINAVGTIEEPIVFRGYRTDNLSPKIPYDRVPAQWYGIKIAPDSYNNHFENVRIRNGIYGILFQPSDTTQLKASLTNTVIQNTTKEVIFAANAKIDAKNSLFANSGTYTIDLIGGSYNFLHCTIANYMLYSGTNRKGTLRILNKGIDNEGKNISGTLGYGRFINTIISGAGNSKEEIKLDSYNELTFNYLFINSFLRIPAIASSSFINTVWNEDPAFKSIYKSGDTTLLYYYDFDLSEDSKAIHKGSRQYAAELPYDIRGISRIRDNGPDIGCFEWKEN